MSCQHRIVLFLCHDVPCVILLFSSLGKLIKITTAKNLLWTLSDTIDVYSRATVPYFLTLSLVSLLYNDHSLFKFVLLQQIHRKWLHLLIWEDEPCLFKAINVAVYCIICSWLFFFSFPFKLLPCFNKEKIFSFGL